MHKITSNRRKQFLFVSVALLLLFAISGIIGAQVIIDGTNASNPPSDWQRKIASANMLYTDTDSKDGILMGYVGNGYLATQINSDAIYVSGVFNGPADSERNPSHRARIPSLVNFHLDPAVSTLQHCGLDISEGVYYRRSQTATKDSKNVFVEQRWFAHRLYRNALVYEMHLLNTSDVSGTTVCMTQHTGADSADITFTPAAGSDVVIMPGETNESETSDIPRIRLAVASTPPPPTTTKTAAADRTLCVPIAKDRPYTYVVVVYTSLDAGDPNVSLAQLSANATALYRKYFQMAKQLIPDKTSVSGPNSELYLSHTAEWHSLWKRGIEVGGDLKLAQAINSSLYYILSSVRHDWYFSLSPGSLSSNAYYGHVFWDTETWMYPTILMLHPELALSILMYRVLRVSEAQEKALSYRKGYTGAMYPWESGFSGVETCPTFALTGLLEHHISGDIAFAVRQFEHTQPATTEIRNILRTMMHPMVFEIARFFASRVTPRPSSDLFDINGVIPPDEYAENVNNSIYTNVIAQITLNYAAEMTTNQTDAKQWRHIAERLYMPFDPKTNVHPEFEGYNGQLIKQADVVLLGYPLVWEGLEPQSRAADLEYYEPRTDHVNGPAMTWGMYAIGWLDLNNEAKAAELFKRSYANVHEPFLVWTETPTAGAVNFITGAGGFLQGTIFGYGGLRISSESLSFNPRLMPNTNTVTFRGVHYRGCSVDISYTAESVTFSNVSYTDKTPALVNVVEKATGMKHALTADGKPIQFACGPFLLVSQ